MLYTLICLTIKEDYMSILTRIIYHTIKSEYKLLDNHPNAKAWQVIVPALAKELNL